MRITVKYFFLLLVVSLGLQFTALAQNNSIAQFSFMLGNWEMKTAKGKITESWKKNKDSLIGESYKHDLNGDSTLTETIIIKKLENSFYYCVTGYEENNNEKTNFKLITVKDKTFVFENKQHDFPQRIIYQYKGSNKLLAWIEGDVSGKKIKSEFPYQKRK